MMRMDPSPFLFGMREIADLHLHPGQGASDLTEYLAEQVDPQAFYDQDHDHASFGMAYMGDDKPDSGHEGGKAVALTLASVIGMFVVQRVKKYVDSHDGAPTTALARISLEFE